MINSQEIWESKKDNFLWKWVVIESHPIGHKCSYCEKKPSRFRIEVPINKTGWFYLETLYNGNRIYLRIIFRDRWIPTPRIKGIKIQ